MKKIYCLLLSMILLSGCTIGDVDTVGVTSQMQEGTEDSQNVTQTTPSKTEVIDGVIAEMTLDEKIGQLLMCDFRKNADNSDMTALSQSAATAIETYQLGGVILFAENIDTKEQTQKLVEEMQALVKIPLFIGVDEEGGLVSRLGKSNIPHETIEPAGQMGSTTRAREAGSIIGMELKELGINVNFAPIADVNTNPDNPVIGERAFSADAEIATEMVATFVEGLQDVGVSAVPKHFPGHGDTETDSHNGEVYVSHDLERLKTVEFLPFKGAIAQGVSFIMMGHIKTPNATGDGMPASLSGDMVSILRKDLGFAGIIITDAMNMGAITQYYDAGEAAVCAIQAGVDIVLMPADIAGAVEGLTQAVRQGTLSEAQIDASLKRILSVKYEKGMLLQLQ